jgi:hypothetical protein
MILKSERDTAMTSTDHTGQMPFLAAALALLAAMIALLFAVDALIPEPGAKRDAWRAFDDGISLARRCDAEIEDHTYDYRWCLHYEGAAASSDAMRAGLYFQAWVSTALAARYGTADAAALASDLSASRDYFLSRSDLSLVRACARQNVKCQVLEKT